jgi:hypothetical protein
MCTRYISPDQTSIARERHIGRTNSDPWLTKVFAREMYSRQQESFVRKSRDDAGYSLQLTAN